MKRIAALFGLVVAGAIVWGLVTYGTRIRWGVRVMWSARAASRHEPAALAAWSKEFGDPATTLAALRIPDNNATANRLVELAPAAGVNLGKNYDSTALETAINAYVNAESTKTEGPVGPPPEAVGSYLESHKPGFDAIVDLLARGEPPAWKTDGWVNSTMPMAGIMQLSYALAAEALAESSRGRDADADRALVASWQLNLALRNYTDTGTITQLMAARITTIQASLARRLRVDAAAWRALLSEHDDQASFVKALVVQADHRFSMGQEKDTSQVARASRADALDLTRAELTRFKTLPVTMEATGGSGFDEAKAWRDGWSLGAIIFAIGEPGDARAWISIEQVTLDLELTDRVLQARQLKARLGRWPATISGVEKSRVNGAQWVYSVVPDGRVSITLNQPLKWASPALRFESRE